MQPSFCMPPLLKASWRVKTGFGGLSDGVIKWLCCSCPAIVLCMQFAFYFHRTTLWDICAQLFRESNSTRNLGQRWRRGQMTLVAKKKKKCIYILKKNQSSGSLCVWGTSQVISAGRSALLSCECPFIAAWAASCCWLSRQPLCKASLSAY